MAGADPNGIKWRGAIAIDVGGVAKAIAVIEAEAASVLVAGPANVIERIGELVAAGWTSSREGPPPEVIDWLCPHGGIAFWPVGAFDDPESGVVAFSSPSIIQLLEGML